MIVEGASVTENLVVDADVCVIGTGAGGAVAAKELAESGLDVAVLEDGDYLRSEDFTGKEDEMVPRLFWDSGMRTTADQSIVIYQGRGVGGSTVHALCYMVRPPESIIDWWRRLSGLESLTYGALEPSIERVEENLKVKQILPEEVNALNRKLRDGANAMGYSGAVQRHNREPCPNCSAACLLGCPYGAKQSMLVTYIPQALDHGARLYTRCRAQRIAVDGDGATGVSATFLDANEQPSYSLRVNAGLVVLAAGAINSPQILLNSGIRGEGRQVGRNLHLHPSAFVGGIFDEEIDSHLGIPQSYYVDHFFQPETDPESGYLIMPIFGPPELFAMKSFSFGPDHWRAMEYYTHTVAILAFLHDRTTGRVTVDRKGRPVVKYRLRDDDRQLMVEGMTRCAELLFTAGANQVTVPYAEPLFIDRGDDLSVIARRGVPDDGVGLASSHPQSTCRMGASPKTSVVDEFGQVHGVRGLFVADASVFPASVGVPPTITISSLADRTAHHIASNFAETTARRQQ